MQNARTPIGREYWKGNCSEGKTCSYAILICFFFFSSRRRHTRCSRDWSSDVCSSDLYEGVGALRDMLQNHMLQVLCIVAMEPPYSLDADVVRDAKAEVLHCLRPMTATDVKRSVVRGQYIEGDICGQRVQGYRHEVRKYFEQVARKP